MLLSRLELLVASILITVLVSASFGCGGGGEPTWLGNNDNDWIKIVNNRGMANVWGVIMDVEKVEGELSINPKGTFGATPEETNASNEVFFGNVVVKLETTGKDYFKLSVNSKRLGNIHKGNRVLVDTDRDVYVDGEPR